MNPFKLEFALKGTDVWHFMASYKTRKEARNHLHFFKKQGCWKGYKIRIRPND